MRLFEILENAVIPFRTKASLYDEARNLDRYAAKLEESYGDAREKETINAKRRAHELTMLSNFPPFPLPLWESRWVILADHLRHPIPDRLVREDFPFDAASRRKRLRENRHV